MDKPAATPRRTWRRALPGAAALLVLLAVALPALALSPAVAGADPSGSGSSAPTRVLTFGPKPTSLADLRARADEVRRQIATIDDQASAIVEQYDQARAKLDELSGRLAAQRLQLDAAQTDLAAQQQTFAERVASMYKSGSTNLLEVVLASNDLTDLEVQVDFYRKITEQDLTNGQQLQGLVKTVQRLTDQAAADRDEARALEADIEAKRIVIIDKLAERQQVLSSLDGKIKKVLADQQAAARRAAALLARNAGVAIGSLPGSAVQLAVVHETMKYLGIPYVWGGATPRGGFDCSGLVLYVYAKFGVHFPHGATMQAHMGIPVPLGQLQPADLVFFGNPSFYHHVGIYIGNGLFIEAPHTGDVVKISKLAGRGVALACRYPITL
jgi:cell wall-associated NlpC family hydrolase